MTTYTGPDRVRRFPSEDAADVASAERITSSPDARPAHTRLREGHLDRRLELIRQLGYPSMELLNRA